MVSNDTPVGNYRYAFIELDDIETLGTNILGQQAKLRMVIEDITNPTYNNGVLSFNEK